jgi:hypothetical protein
MQTSLAPANVGRVLSGAGLCTDVKPGYISDAGLLSYSGDRGVHVCTDKRQTVLTVIPTSNNVS